jgi:hypothetical protein
MVDVVAPSADANATATQILEATASVEAKTPLASASAQSEQPAGVFSLAGSVEAPAPTVAAQLVTRARPVTVIGGGYFPEPPVTPKPRLQWWRTVEWLPDEATAAVETPAPMAEMQAAVVFDMSAAVEAVAAEAAGDLTLAFDASGDAHNSAADASAVLEARRPQVLVPRRNRSNYLAALAELDEDLALVAQRRRVAA